mmetsp:Transcript_20853/g.35623  ORF Transcript_20853/g.35623 Transcript_20853/m.35623 type:complete len:105 (-) Transcript_20853:307-621(-)
MLGQIWPGLVSRVSFSILLLLNLQTFRPPGHAWTRLLSDSLPLSDRLPQTASNTWGSTRLLPKPENDARDDASQVTGAWVGVIQLAACYLVSKPTGTSKKTTHD